jgi:hypothetical protein
MLVFWGKQRVEKKEGFFVDLCPVCRKFTAYQLYRISLAKTLYGRARGEGEPRGHEGMCLECGTRVDVDPSDYRSFYETPGNSISNLIRDTFPAIRKARAKRLQLEMALREGTLKTDDRRKLMMEPFQLFEESTRRIFQQPWRWFSVIGLTVVTGCFAGTGWLVARNYSSLSEHERMVYSPAGAAMMIFAAIFVVAWCAAVYVLMAARRPFHRRILPSLALALKPLRPSREELAGCLEEMRMAKAVIGRKVKLTTLWKKLE